ncbi:MAG: hypothetical protein AABY86_15925, partial [Bdellovibrionota bacterium]
MQKLFIGLFLLSCGLIATGVSVAHEASLNIPPGPHEHPDTTYIPAVKWNPPAYPVEDYTYSWGAGGGRSIDGPEGYYPRVRPFKSAITPHNPFKTDLGEINPAIIGRNEFDQCNPMAGNHTNPNSTSDACVGNLKCVEETEDGRILCPGRETEVILTDDDQAQCGSGSGVTTKCVPDQQQSPGQPPCIADMKWHSSTKVFHTIPVEVGDNHELKWYNKAGNNLPQWQWSDGPRKRCFFQHACYLNKTPEH